MHTTVNGRSASLLLPALALVACGVEAEQRAERIPETASAYARMVEPELGVVPTVDCGAGVPIPIYVDGVEVRESQAPHACDNPDFKGNCYTGSRIRRLEGTDTDGQPLPDVVWVQLCRSSGREYFERGVVSVQMIGHNPVTGATAFFEAPDADPGHPNDQPSYLHFDDDGLLAGTLPGPDDPDFDRVFIPPPVQCSRCHQADPFIHDPFVDSARLPEDPSQPVIPELARPDSLYHIIGGEDWDRRTVHIEGNGCTTCHRAPEPERFLSIGGHDVNDFMPPHAPGTMRADYEAIRTCYDQGPENTPGCVWVEPPDAR